MNNVRKVPHPDKLFIQINDEDEHTLSFSFSDDYSESTGIDPNELDDESLDRLQNALACVYMCIERKRKDGMNIDFLKKDISQ